MILVLCNMFRNMPVGVRAGIAAMSQIDRSLDEASMTLGARGFTDLRTILLPLLKPAVVAALVYSFVRAMTTRVAPSSSSCPRNTNGRRPTSSIASSTATTASRSPTARC